MYIQIKSERELKAIFKRKREEIKDSVECDNAQYKKLHISKLLHDAQLYHVEIYRLAGQRFKVVWPTKYRNKLVVQLPEPYERNNGIMTQLIVDPDFTETPINVTYITALATIGQNNSLGQCPANKCLDYRVVKFNENGTGSCSICGIQYRIVGIQVQTYGGEKDVSKTETETTENEEN